jgi:hypothetical protein
MHREEHHVIPLSVSGPNWKENCVVLTNQEHKQVHEVLDIPYGIIRRFRKRTNHLAYIDIYYVQELVKLQELYFARMPHMTTTLQKKHVRCMRDVVKRSLKEYNGYELPDFTQEKCESTNPSVLFKFYLKMYHDILLQVAIYNEARLPTQTHPR